MTTDPASPAGASTSATGTATPAVATPPTATPAPVVAAATPASSPSTLITPHHCPYQRVTDLLQRLAPGRMRIGFFLGAGCPLAVQVVGPSGAKPLIPELSGLTAEVKAVLDNNNDLKADTKKVWDRVIDRGFSRPNIEDVLTHIRALVALAGISGVDGFTKAKLLALDEAICTEVRRIVNQTMTTRNTPYHVLASWIQAISREKPVEVFTTNYDLLLEQAFEEQHLPYFDGFVGAHRAFLDHEAIYEDDLPPRWARLWKIHGSVNWWITNDGRIRRSADPIPGEQLLIYPSHLKYDQSRQMPYFAMLDRLRVFLHSGQCLLLTCGYSFGDEHINATLVQGLASNPDAACVGMSYGDKSAVPLAVAMAKQHANLTLLSADGAIVGTVEHSWNSDDREDQNPAFPIAVGKNLPASRTAAPPGQCNWLLGDFQSLGMFLGHQLASRVLESRVDIAS